jgi:hypothetical protein
MRTGRHGVQAGRWLTGGLLVLFGGLLVALVGCAGGSSPDVPLHSAPKAAAKADHSHPLSTAPALPLPPRDLSPDASPAVPPPPPGQATDGQNAGEGLAATTGGGRSPLGGKGKDGGTPEKKPEAPQVWHRDANRPTFARVYVGDNNSLELVSLHVTVTVEGPRARTLVDHVFRNPHDRQLEGTFEYPLPTGASPSYFAMFLGQTRDTPPPRWGPRGNIPPPSDALARLSPQQVVKQISTADWGRLQEGHIVAKEKALETYEDIVRGRIDPALLEYAGGNTFSGRVFPIPPKGYNRVLIAYEELLPLAREQCAYRFALPDCKLTELRFTLNASAGECKDAVFQPKDATKAEGGDTLSYTKTWTEKGPGGEAIFAFHPPQPRVQAISGRQGESGPLYLYARIRPDLKVEKAAPFSENAVFLLDTSLSEHPDRFAVSMKLLRKILETDPDIKRFNVLTFSVGAAWVEPNGWLDNTPAGREKVFDRLDGLLLEGATDLSAALDKLVQPGFVADSAAPLNVFLLSDGQITWGEDNAAALAARFEARCPVPMRFHCYRTGIGADNQELFEALTRRGGGIFNCYGEAELAACAAAHRSQCLQIDSVKIVGGPEAEDVLVAGRKAAVYPGGDLIVAARMRQPGHTSVVVEGTFLGQKFAQEYGVEVGRFSDLAGRGWGEIAVASLLALNDPKLDNVITAYCQEFGIGSRLASFLVLENENDYKRLNLEQERGQAVQGDLGAFLNMIWASLARAVGPKESFERFLRQVDDRLKVRADGQVKRLLALLSDKDFDVPVSELAGSLLSRDQVPPAYLTAREANRGDVAPYLNESRRRAGLHDTAGAVRALSCVIETNPGRTDALRLVGYRLLDLDQPGQAARLFGQVQRQRPFEPHSYRDLARALESNGRYGLAALNYEIVLAGTWHNRFRDSLKHVAREDYAQMMQQALRQPGVSPEVADFFGQRLKGLGSQRQGDLRVTISWNSDATDVDLWVIEPDGSKCFYQNRRTRSGELSEDMTQGYGPERYQAMKALPGEYRVIVHYFSPNPNLLGGETHVNVVVTRHAGTPQETTERHTVILKKKNEQVEVRRVKF